MIKQIKKHFKGNQLNGQKSVNLLLEYSWGSFKTFPIIFRKQRMSQRSKNRAVEIRTLCSLILSLVRVLNVENFLVLDFIATISTYLHSKLK